MTISGEFDPGRCPMLVDVGKEVCKTCGLKMCKLVDLIEAWREDD